MHRALAVRAQCSTCATFTCQSARQTRALAFVLFVVVVVVVIVVEERQADGVSVKPTTLQTCERTRLGEVAGVPERILDELAQTLVEKLDILLDRLAGRAVTVPGAGSSAWGSQWHDRDSDAGRERHSHRLHVRAVIATRAGLSLREPGEQDELAPPVAPRRRPRRGRVDENQLTIF